MVNKAIYIVLILVLFSFHLDAREFHYGKTGKRKPVSNLAANCDNPTGSSIMEWNNVRSIVQTGGDMWWNLTIPIYEVPKGPVAGTGQNALFAGSLWLAGTDASGQIKVAAQRYRTNGVDFYTGPLNVQTGEIDRTTCAEWDKHFITTKAQVERFNTWYVTGEPENYIVPDTLRDWPGNGDVALGQDLFLAPFFDRNEDGVYSVDDGDYPLYDLGGEDGQRNTECGGNLDELYGDQNFWWVFNDRGNIHNETQAEPIGMEIRAQAFAFSTSDEVNNMTFYNYKLLNRSTFDLRDAYFGFHVDADLGNAFDDFVGCDVQRGLGFCYNGDEFDEDVQGRPGYGADPPAIGVDFFQGPFQDSDGRDNCVCATYIDAIADDGIVYDGSGVNYGNGKVDDERLGMRAFLWYNNGAGVQGDPTIGIQYYNYLRSIWKNNSKMYYGGTGFETSADNPLIEADFMFPGDSDPLGWGTGGQPQRTWTEDSEGNTPFDRRFVQSAGPFVLAPGAQNYITVGVVWARGVGGSQASIEALKAADTKTQALFDNCFALLDGPDAPTLQITELENEFIFKIVNLAGNNVGDNYKEQDPFISVPDTLVFEGQDVTQFSNQELYDSLAFEYAAYTFQGYQVFQLRDASVSLGDLRNPDLSRLVYQCDIRDDITDLINFDFDQELKLDVPRFYVQNARNEGLLKTFTVTQDLFAEGDSRLINHKTYYYTAIAYAHNEYKEYDPSDPFKLDGQKQPYFGSRKSPTGPIVIFSAIPHSTNPQNGGTNLNAAYGDGIPLKRIEGVGNGAFNLLLDNGEVDSLLFDPPYRIDHPTYQAGSAPIEIKVIDPLAVVGGNFQLAFKDTTTIGDLSDAYWELTGDVIADTIRPVSNISVQSEQIIEELGISILIRNPLPAGQDPINNGLIGAEIVFDDPSRPWLTGVPDADGLQPQNWIRSGDFAEEDSPEYSDYNITWSGSKEGVGLDPDEYYEQILGGTWAPFRLAGNAIHGPVPFTYNNNVRFNNANTNGENVLFSLWGGNISPIPNRVQLTPAGFYMQFVHGVDIRITSDQSKWTRCPVLEAQDDPALAIGNAPKMTLRRSPSVDKNGMASNIGDSEDENASNFIADTGFSWFPGYAVDVETGERLNMAFSEDSYLASENGNDMIWNPTSRIYEGVGSNTVRFGGKHYIYVFRNAAEEEGLLGSPTTYFNSDTNRMPAYDEGRFIAHKYKDAPTNDDYRVVMRAGMWVGLPLLADGFSLLETDVTLRFRVTKNFQAYANGEYLNVGDVLQPGVEYLVNQGPVQYDTLVLNRGDAITGYTNDGGVLIPLEAIPGQTGSDTTRNVIATLNGGRPFYEFTIPQSMVPEFNVRSTVESALDDILIVPNPYYAYSSYETDKTDNRVKIVNLPKQCKISIYTLNGVLVRELTKDDDGITSVDWDLKNEARIPIASGAYIIHVNVPGVGERVLKWFGVMRPVDLDSF